MSTVDSTKEALPSRVSELPGQYHEVARSFQPAIAKAIKQYSALELVRILTAAVGEEFATNRKPKTGLAMALLRGTAVREEMKEAEGGSLSAEQAGAKLGISKAAILKRYQKGQLLGWREAKQNAVRFPVWQFTNDNLLPGLSEVLSLFHHEEWLDGWGKIAFFLTPLASMKKRRPLDLLREGEILRVMASAQAHVE